MAGQRLHIGIVLSAERFLLPLLHDLNFIEIRFLPVQGADTFQDIVAFRCFNNTADFPVAKLKRRRFTGRIHLPFSDGYGTLRRLIVSGGHHIKVLSVFYPPERFFRPGIGIASLLLRIRFRIARFFLFCELYQNLLSSASVSDSK